ncbi:MAG: type I restriction-modification system subunit M, partial [Nitrospira sp.]|nr:type I restriction-modification system subunit M [Nitrospira sp.]
MAIKKSDLYSSLWASCDELRGGMDASQYKDYVLFMLFIKYVSDKYGDSDDFAPPVVIPKGASFKDMVALKGHSDIGNLINTQVIQPLIDANQRLARSDFPDFNDSNKLGDGAQKVEKLGNLIAIFENPALDFSKNRAENDDILGDAYEYLIGQFAAGSGKKAGEFYTPQQISNILSAIVTLDSQEPKTGPRGSLPSVFDFACGSGSLLLNIRHRMKENGGTIGKIYGQEYNITTYNLARMNMLLHGVKDTEFEIFHGDTLKNEWDWLRETNPAKKPAFDAVVANPPFSYRWDPSESMGDDVRFKNHGLAPKSAADFAFLLHGFHFLKDEGVMAIILPHGVLFRGGAEEKIRTKLLKDGHIDTVIGLPANLFYSTGIPVCILVLKKCKKPDDVLFINAAEHFEKGKRQNQLKPEHIAKIIETYRHRTEEPRYS